MNRVKIIQSNKCREINHHGKSVKVGDVEKDEKLFVKTINVEDSNGNIAPTYENMTSTNELIEQGALKTFYENAIIEEKFLKTGEFLGIYIFKNSIFVCKLPIFISQEGYSHCDFGILFHLLVLWIV